MYTVCRKMNTHTRVVLYMNKLITFITQSETIYYLLLNRATFCTHMIALYSDGIYVVGTQIDNLYSDDQ